MAGWVMARMRENDYEVDLTGSKRPSQNDLFVLGRIGADLAVMMVEGKVAVT
jgi:hypothetical protein